MSFVIKIMRGADLLDIGLGDEAKDTVTGFMGRVSAICVYDGGSSRACIERLKVDGETIREWFDLGRLEVVR